MGFFSDLKDDLSQAVNELMPEEELEAALAGDETDPAEAVISEPAEPAESLAAASQDTVPTPDDLSNMLDMMEAINIESSDTDADIEALLAESTATVEVSEPAAVEIEQPQAAPEPEVQPEAIVQPEADEAPAIEEPIVEEPIIETPVQKEEAAEVKKSQHEKRGEEKKMDMQGKVASDETAVVTEGMSITGDITSGGSLELIGSVVGNIEVLGKLNITGSIQGNSKAAEIFAEGARINGEVNSQGSVKIGQSSVVIGNINANSAVVAGAVKGDIDVHGPVILDTSAIVMGNIKSKSVQINNGAVIEGMCSQCYAEVNPMSFFEEIKNKSKKEK